MDDSWIWQILLQLILIGFNAVFACAEIAVLSVSETKLEKLAEEGNKKAIKLSKLTEQPAKFLSTIQVAITLSGFFASAFAAENFSDNVVDWLIGLGVTISPQTLKTISVVCITILLSYITLVLGELVPKRVAMKKSEQVALGMASFVTVVSKLFAPIVWLLTVSTNGILRLFGIDPNATEENVDEEDIRMMIDAGSEKGTIDVAEKEIIQNVFEFDDISVGEIATHRTEVSVLWTEETPEQWNETINNSRHSMYPICEESIDNVVGVLRTKDYFRLSDKSRESIMENAVKPAAFVLESVSADVLFKNMQTSHNHFSVVLDEYGGVVGIITMNDLLEQLVGELEDDNEALEEEPTIEKIDSGTWKITGNVTLEELSEQLGISLESEDYDTLSGLVFNTYGSIPEDGSTFDVETDDLIIKVSEIIDHKVEKATVCLIQKDPEEANAEKL